MKSVSLTKQHSIFSNIQRLIALMCVITIMIPSSICFAEEKSGTSRLTNGLTLEEFAARYSEAVKLCDEALKSQSSVASTLSLDEIERHKTTDTSILDGEKYYPSGLLGFSFIQSDDGDILSISFEGDVSSDDRLRASIIELYCFCYALDPALSHDSFGLEEAMDFVEEAYDEKSGIVHNSNMCAWFISNDHLIGYFVIGNKGYGSSSENAASTDITTGKKNALDKAISYLEVSVFSYDKLIEQLEIADFTHEEAVYAADNCGADWNEQAAKKAEEYIKNSSFTKRALIKQLKSDGFTADEAKYAAQKAGL